MKESFARYRDKLAAVIRQDGLFSGVKTALVKSYELVRRPKPADILFISSGAIGDSWRYRVKNVAEELELHDISASIAVQENIWLDGCADKFKIFILHRVQGTPAVSKLIEKIKAQGKEIIFETDDLIFDPEYLLGQDFFQNSSAEMKKFYGKGVGADFVADPYVKTATTTTNFLAEKLREKGKRVFLVRNRLSNSDLEITEKILRSKTMKTGDEIRIGYFSGAIGHNKDFASINDALMEIMEKFENITLLLAGPLDIMNNLNKFKERVIFTPFVSRAKHFKNIAAVDINIAPLEITNPFCEGKSELKFFEAGILKIPTIASATQTFREAIEDGQDGFLAGNNAEWVEKMERLILDKKSRETMGEKAREKSLREYTNKNSHNEEYYGYLKNILNR